MSAEAPSIDEARETMRRVVENLDGEYGPKRGRRSRDVLDELVATILSQQNSSVSTRAVFASLKARFPTWDDAVDAPVEEIEEAIRSGGLSRQKSARIKRLLEAIRDEHGSLELGFLEKLPAEEALRYLKSFSGDGEQRARCTLLFTIGLAVFPMDVHIFRILERLGLLRPNTPDERAHREIEALIPAGKHYSAHVNLVEHGRKICRPTAPRCDACCLLDYCPTGQQRLGAAEEADPRLVR
jgi:endonuclease-3